MQIVFLTGELRNEVKAPVPNIVGFIKLKGLIADNIFVFFSVPLLNE